ncbi:SDR family oxidoreductase [Pseudochelatococcus sp. B33]
MQVFITGANGFIGSAVVSELLAAGHQVLGLARSEEAERALQAAGVEVQRGSLADHDGLRAGAAKADGVIHLAFNPDYANFQQACDLDRRAIEVIGEALVGTGKPFLVPNGLAGLAPRRVVTEDDGIPADYRFPRMSEQTALRLASQGVAASVVRLSQIHDTSRQGLVTSLIQIARATGVSAYVGDGGNRWPAAHISDVARLFRLVLEAPETGAKYHAVAEEGIELRAIAETIGRVLGLPVRSFGSAEAEGHFGPFALFATQDMPASSKATARKTGWHPTGPGLLDDLEKIG